MNGLEALIFIAEGDMRNALNALQSTVSGFETVTAENVFKVSMHVYIYIDVVYVWCMYIIYSVYCIPYVCYMLCTVCLYCVYYSFLICYVYTM